MPTGFSFTTTRCPAGERIPREHTCEGVDVCPLLEWRHVPTETESIALIVDDPKTPGQTFTYWVLFNFAPDATSVPRDVDVEVTFLDIEVGVPCPGTGAIVTSSASMRSIR